MNAGNKRRWLQCHALLLLCAAALLLAVFENTRLDVALQAWFFDPATRDFPLRTHWFFSDVLHHGLKSASYFMGVLALVLCVVGLRGQIDWLPRRHAALAALGMLLIPLGTTLLKMLTNRHCPWDVIDFGGYAPYVGLLDANPEGIKRGACFPAGHASGGFVWIVWAVALAALRPGLARAALWGALALGALMGGARMMQGAHFLSHTLWSMWWAWAVCVVLVSFLRVPLGQTAPASAPP